MNGPDYINLSLEYLEKLAGQEPELLGKKVYHTFSKFSSLAIEAKQKNFKRGWALGMEDRHGKFFNSKEARTIEDAFQTCIKPFFNGIHSLVKTSKNNRIDKIFTEIQHHYADIDLKLNELSRELGSFRFFYEKKHNFTVSFPLPLLQPPNFTIIKIPEKSNGISILINLILESIRSILSTNDSNEIRESISIFLLALIDILKGEWKQAFLNLAAFYNDAPLVAELIGKVLFILIELSTNELSRIMNQSNKTILIAFCLWGFSFSLESEQLAVKKQLDEMHHSEHHMNKNSDMFILNKDDITALQSIKNLDELQDTPIYKHPLTHLILELMHTQLE